MFSLFHFLVVGSARQIKPTRVSFQARVKIAYRIGASFVERSNGQNTRNLSPRVALIYNSIDRLLHDCQECTQAVDVAPSPPPTAAARSLLHATSASCTDETTLLNSNRNRKMITCTPSASSHTLYEQLKITVMSKSQSRSGFKSRFQHIWRFELN